MAKHICLVCFIPIQQEETDSQERMPIFFFPPVPLSSADKSRNKSWGKGVGVEVEMVNKRYCTGWWTILNVQLALEEDFCFFPSQSWLSRPWYEVRLLL